MCPMGPSGDLIWNDPVANERHVLNLYKRLLSTKCINANVSEVGLILSETYPYLGASLDGLVEDESDNRWGVEIKCPASQFGKTLHEAINNKKFFSPEAWR